MATLGGAKGEGGRGPWDVVGLAQAMVDYAGQVEDGFLADRGLAKGARNIIGHEERGRFLEEVGGESFKVAPGGSLSNTLVALGRLGAASRHGGDPGSGLRVAMAGPCGNDPVGDFYRARIGKAGVEFLSEPGEGSTGTVIVLTTPDAQRTMLSHGGSSEALALDARVRAAVEGASILLIEGYLWEMAGTVGAIREAIAAAKRAGTLVALTASDTSLVDRYRADLLDLLDGQVDILFANGAESEALTGLADVRAASMRLAERCPLVAVTDGSKGSVLVCEGAMHLIPPYWAKDSPVDTCGAGDAYAAGVLYGLLSGAGISGIGGAGARVASTVIGRQGARLKVEDAELLAGCLPSHMYDQQTVDEANALEQELDLRYGALS